MTVTDTAKRYVLTEHQLEAAIQERINMTVPVTSKAAPAKPGWQTTEFWVSILATVGAVAAAQQNAVPDRYAAYVAMVSTIAYALSRGLAKH